ncbi:Cse1-domain-containing protein [Blastocladiella britannica]|nr:Cse1-domain-containing protein [Blastocladiella britannica]
MTAAASDPHLMHLHAIFARTLQATEQRSATKDLTDLEAGPGFGPALLRLIAATQADFTIRFTAVVYLKNFVKRHWDKVDGPDQIISDADRAAIKDVIVNVMTTTEPNLQLQLSETVSMIAQSDFPHDWPTLIEQLVSKLTTDNFQVNNAVLLAAHPVFKRWRYQDRSDLLFTTINHVMETFAQSYDGLFQETDRRLSELLASTAAPTAETRAAAALYSNTMLLLAKIFYSLNAQDIPQFFIDRQDQYFNVFLRYMRPSPSPLVDSGSADEAHAFDKLQTVLCEICSLYSDKYAEDWHHMNACIEATWVLLTKTSAAVKHDFLVARALSLLTAVVRRQNVRAQFENAAILQQIIEQIVMPNLSLRDEDQEMFEDEPVEYVRRDLMSADAETRRRGATDLVKGLLEQFEALVAPLCQSMIDGAMSQVAGLPRPLSEAAWRHKDAAVALFMASATKSRLSATGVSSTSLDVATFFGQHLMADLQVASPSQAGLPTITALKFVHMFRQQLPPAVHAQTLAMAASLLACPNFAVVTWAAAVIDVQLTQVFPRGSAVAAQTIEAAGSGAALGASGSSLVREVAVRLGAVITRESESNKVQDHDHILRSLLRCIQHAPADLDTNAAMGAIVHGMQLTVANPANPRFSQFLFECIAALIKLAAKHASVADFENFLFPMFGNVLQQSETNETTGEFVPYVFQIMAQMLQTHPVATDSGAPAALPSGYDQLLQSVLGPKLWEAQGNVPALVALVQSYLSRGAAAVVARNQLPAILGIFQKLLGSRATDQHALELLQSTMYYVPAQAFDQYRSAVLSLALTRLSMPAARGFKAQQGKQRFAANFTEFLGFYLSMATPAVDAVGAALDAVQPGILQQLLHSVVVPALGHVGGKHARRVTTLGLVRWLCETADTSNPELANSVAMAVWVFGVQTFKDKSAAVPTGPSDGAAAAAFGAASADALAGAGLEEDEDMSYQAGFSRLSGTGLARPDPMPAANGASDIKYLVSRWGEVCSRWPAVAAHFGPGGRFATDLTALVTAVQEGRA